MLRSYETKKTNTVIEEVGISAYEVTGSYNLFTDSFATKKSKVKLESEAFFPIHSETKSCIC